MNPGGHTVGGYGAAGGYNAQSGYPGMMAGGGGGGSGYSYSQPPNGGISQARQERLRCGLVGAQVCEVEKYPTGVFPRGVILSMPEVNKKSFIIF